MGKDKMARPKRKSPKKSATHQIQATSSEMPPELLELEKIVGQFMEYWGFKNIHGRIWTHLYTSKLPLDSIELMARLKVSKGLMSLALRDLVEYEVILSDHIGRHGTTFYRANSNLLSVITNVLENRETQMLKQAKKSCETLQRVKPQSLEKAGLDAEKIQSILNLTQSAQILLQTFLMQEGDGFDIAIFDSILSPPT